MAGAVMAEDAGPWVRFLRWCGLALVAAGVLMVVATLLHPSHKTASTIVASEPRLVAAHVVYTMTWLLVILGLPGIYAAQRGGMGRLGLVFFDCFLRHLSDRGDWELQLPRPGFGQTVTGRAGLPEPVPSLRSGLRRWLRRKEPQQGVDDHQQQHEIRRDPHIVLGNHLQPVPDAGTAQTCLDLCRLEVLLLRFLDYLGKQMYLLICWRSLTLPTPTGRAPGEEASSTDGAACCLG
jgi:hypothetical protein